MRDSMKGEITRSKRHLKGHRSKLSFSRLAATHGSHLDFSHTPLCSRAAEHCAANHQVINCPPPQIWRKIGKLCWALISLAIRAHFLKSPKRLPRFCHQGQEADEERRRLPNVNSHAAERWGIGERVHTAEMESTPSFRVPLDVTWRSRHGIFI